MIKKVGDAKQALPVSLLDELRSEQVKKRLNAVAQLKVIAAALGPDRTRNELVPFLSEFIDDEEQVLLLLIETMRDMAGMIGGEQHERCLVPILMAFCRSDERTVSEAALNALMCIIRRMDLKKNEDFVTDVIKKLVESDSIGSKQSGIGLLAGLLRDLNQVPLLEIYVGFATDSSFKLRKIATKHLKTIVKNLQGNSAAIGKVVGSLLNDREDLIKMLTLEGAIQYFTENPALVLDNLKNLLISNSWRINMKICEELPNLLRQLSRAQWKSYLEQAYFKFLGHEEPELKAAACACLPAVCALMDPSDIIRLLMPAIQRLATDPKPFVRVEVAKVFLMLSQFVPKQFTQDTLLPMMAGFLNDTDPNTNLAVFSALPSLFNYIPLQQLEETTLQCINQLFASTNWRTKCRAVEIMAEFIKFPAFLNDRIINIVMGWAYDKVDAVRFKAIGLLETLIRTGDALLVEGKILPKLIAMQTCPSYLQRQLVLHIIDRTVRNVSQDVLNNSYFPVMAALSKDRVPNLRFMVARILRNNPALISNIRFKALLEALSEDRDVEVKQEIRMVSAC